MSDDATAFNPVGSVSSCSVVSDCWATVFWTSTSGLAPVTVIVSSIPPTAISASMLAVNPAVSTTPSRMTVEKPGRVKVTE